MRTIRRRLALNLRWLVGLLIVVPVVWVPPAGADVPPPARVISNYETATGLQLHRDCGYSAQLPEDPSQSLWLFCDTLQTDAAGNPTPALLPFWPGTFAAVGPSTPGLVPTGLSELPSPGTPPGPLPSNRGPALFLPNPADLKAPDGVTPCGQVPPGVPPEGYGGFAPTWALGVTQGPTAPITMTQDGVPLTISDPSSLLFVTYVEGCITTVPGDETALDARAKRVGLAAYDPRTNTIVARSTVRSVETPGGALPFPLQSLFHPQFLNGYLYTYAVACDQMIPAYGACGAGRVLTARVPLDSLAVGSAYEYSTSTGWTSDPIQAETVLPDIGNGFGPLAVHVGDFSSVGEGYLLMEQVSAGGHYRLWQSYSPAGPWTLTRTDVVPGCGSGPGLGCYHVWGHPDLSTEINLLYSFFDQNEMDSFVRVASIGTVP